MSKPEVPNFGALLGAAVSELPDAARPALLCGLERAAARRYRDWAAELPAHAEALHGCAQREDEIADLVSGLFPIDAALQEAVDKALPAAIAIFLNAFDEHPALDQLYIQSEAELQGAAAWVGIAQAVDDPADKATLARCSALEEESSRVVKDLLAASD
jgi:hypothetical protein